MDRCCQASLCRLTGCGAEGVLGTFYLPPLAAAWLTPWFCRAGYATDWNILCHIRRQAHPTLTSLSMMQGPSPDEVALAEGARQLGFEFVSRSSNGIVLMLQGTEAR